MEELQSKIGFKMMYLRQFTHCRMLESKFGCLPVTSSKLLKISVNHASFFTSKICKLIDYPHLMMSKIIAKGHKFRKIMKDLKMESCSVFLLRLMLSTS